MGNLSSSATRQRTATIQAGHHAAHGANEQGRRTAPPAGPRRWGRSRSAGGCGNLGERVGRSWSSPHRSSQAMTRPRRGVQGEKRALHQEQNIRRAPVGRHQLRRVLRGWAGRREGEHPPLRTRGTLEPRRHTIQQQRVESAISQHNTLATDRTRRRQTTVDQQRTTSDDTRPHQTRP